MVCVIISSGMTQQMQPRSHTSVAACTGPSPDLDDQQSIADKGEAWSPTSHC